MNSFPVQQRFLVRLAVIGSPDDAIRSMGVDLEEELRARPHFRTLHVYWDDDARRMVVDVEDVGWDVKDAADGMAEELFEIVPAVLAAFEQFSIEIVDVRPVDEYQLH